MKIKLTKNAILVFAVVLLAIALFETLRDWEAHKNAFKRGFNGEPLEISTTKSIK